MTTEVRFHIYSMMCLLEFTREEQLPNRDNLCVVSYN